MISGNHSNYSGSNRESRVSYCVAQFKHCCYLRSDTQDKYIPACAYTTQLTRETTWRLLWSHPMILESTGKTPFLYLSLSFTPCLRSTDNFLIFSGLIFVSRKKCCKSCFSSRVVVQKISFSRLFIWLKIWRTSMAWNIKRQFPDFYDLFSLVELNI